MLKRKCIEEPKKYTCTHAVCCPALKKNDSRKSIVSLPAIFYVFVVLLRLLVFEILDRRKEREGMFISRDFGMEGLSLRSRPGSGDSLL